MTGFLVIDDGTDRARWLEARGLGVSATDAARILTGGAGTRASLRREKQTGRGFGGNAYTAHGREREEAIAEWARANFGLIPSTALIARAQYVDGPAWHAPTAFGLDLATPDALAEPHAVGEFGWRAVSTFGEFKTTVHDWDTWADVPKRYHWQVVWQFHVTGADRCIFAFEAHEGFVPLHMEPRRFVIERADVAEDIEHAVATVADWRAAGEGEPEIPDALVPLDGLMTARQRAKEEAAAAEAKAAEYEAQMRALLDEHGQAYEFEGTDANLSWSGVPRSSQRFNAAAFKKKYPAAYRRFTTTTTEAQPRLGITTARS